MADETDKVVPLPGAKRRRVSNQPALRSDGNVEVLPSHTTRHDLPVERILIEAGDHGLDEVIVMGWDLNGDLYCRRSMSSEPHANYLIDLAKAALLAS